MTAPTPRPQLRTEPCACGGTIKADPWAPGPAVLAHNRSPRHTAWRLGLEPVQQGWAGDGMPVYTWRDRQGPR